MEQIGDAKPSLASILDDRAYEREVLRLGEDQEEDHIQDALLREAQNAGVPPEVWKPVTTPKPRLLSLPVHRSSTSASISPSPPQRRSDSIDSHKTCSTAATAYSKPSVDHRSSSSTSPSKRFLNFKRLSLESERSPVDTPPSTRQQSTTSLEVPSNRSSISAGESERSSRRRSTIQRGLSKLSMLKRFHTGGSHDGKQSCSRCVQAHEPQRTPTVDLPCEHTICRAHLRKLVVDALVSRRMSALQCCGRPFSIEVLQDVSREQEMDVILQEVATPLFEPSDPFHDLGRAMSPEITEHQGIWTLRNDSGWTDHEDEEEEVEHPNDFEDDHSEEARRNAYCATTDPDFRSMRNAQLDERDRFLEFERQQKQTLRDYQARCRADHAQTCELEEEELEQTHAEALLTLEEKHLAAEMDLLALHEQEKRNCALALRHMEAYCFGEADSTNSRNITDIDRRELEKQHWESNNLERHHQSAINVLREQQARHLRKTAAKQSQEMQVLAEKHGSKLEELEHEFTAQDNELEKVMQERRRRMTQRWKLAQEIWKRRRADVGRLKLPYPIEPVGWPQVDGAGRRDSVLESPGPLEL